MKQSSNNGISYWNQIKNSLLKTSNSKDYRFQYLEIGQLLSHGFSLTQTKNNSQELILKIWNAGYDNKRFNKGILNFDKLAITDKKIKLSSEESETINRLLNSTLELTNWKGIVLDGLFCQFEINNRILKWNINKEINDKLTELIELLRAKTKDNYIKR